MLRRTPNLLTHVKHYNLNPSQSRGSKLDFVLKHRRMYPENQCTRGGCILELYMDEQRFPIQTITSRIPLSFDPSKLYLLHSPLHRQYGPIQSQSRQGCRASNASSQSRYPPVGSTDPSLPA